MPGSWQDLELGAPEIARLGMDRIKAAHVALLGTVRRDGSPRISPIEPYFARGELLVGAMAWSTKAADLQRNLAVNARAGRRRPRQEMQITLF